MTDDERAILAALGRIKLGKFSSDRGFVADLAAKAEKYDPQLTGRQTDYLYSLRWKYRKQIAELGAPVPGEAEGRKAFERWKENKGARPDGARGGPRTGSEEPEPAPDHDPGPHDGRLL